jgi:hypothetical protein
MRKTSDKSQLRDITKPASPRSCRGQTHTGSLENLHLGGGRTLDVVESWAIGETGVLSPCGPSACRANTQKKVGIRSGNFSVVHNFSVNLKLVFNSELRIFLVLKRKKAHTQTAF